MAIVAFVLGVVAGAGGVLGWQARPEPPPAGPSRAEPPPFRVDEHAVELLLVEAAPPRSRPGGREPADSLLHVDGVVLLLGRATATVLSIGSLGGGLDLRAPALPVTVSPTTRFRSIDLDIVVRDCAAAARWAPVDRPFAITWRDRDGMEHTDRVGDFDRSMARMLTRHIGAVCGTSRTR